MAVPRLLLAVVPLLALMLAGCNDADGGRDAPSSDEECDLEPVLCDPDHYLANHHCIVNDVHPRVYAPDTPGPDHVANPWQPGSFWTYRLRAGGSDTTSELVYYDDIDLDGAGRAQHYLVGTASADEALDHALFSVNPMLGRIHRTLYSPHESGLHADMFNFPLCEGATWTTEFYGTTFDLVAHRAQVALPGGTTDDGFRIEGTSADGSTLVHTYSPTARWFTQIDLDRADGTSVQMDLVDYGGGRQGTYHFLRAQKDEVLDLAVLEAGRSVPVGREDGGEGPYTSVGVWADVQRQGTGKVEVLLRDPAGNVRACIGFAGQGLGGTLRAGCVDAAAADLKAQVPYVQGDWTVTLEKALLDPTTVAGEMRLVSIYDRSGTV